MISQTAEYALRAVTFLAQQPGAAKTTREIATTTRVPLNYLYKVLQALGRHALVGSQRGLHGGYVLARAPRDITVLEVVNAVDPVQRIRCCPLDIPGHAQLCPLHRRLDEAMRMVEDALGHSSLAEFLNGDAASTPFCRPGSPRAPRGAFRKRQRKPA